jgi:uncharacterized protein (DUF1800 family)
MKRLTTTIACLGMALMLGACGGSSGSGPAPGPAPAPNPTPAPITISEAFGFLNQASFGATTEAAEQVINIGYEQWIDNQMALPASRQVPYLTTVPTPQFPFQRHADRVDAWFENAVNGSDQLRQRVAFALSEIMVVSQNGALFNLPFAAADYYDMLARNAFGNYRVLIEDVTLHPAMGVFLSMLGNEKPDPARNIRPDENYARELMQLFSIGLVELNPDGSVVTDSNGVPVPTYDQAIIEAFAHIYTGWHWANGASFAQARPGPFNQTIPMQLYPDFHDTGSKTLLGGVVVPAGQSGEQDLEAALDNIFNHPNVGPFIATRLIQRLVTSNPSPQYIERVASTFDNNGFGVRGDLGVVVKAILLDDEARNPTNTDVAGKLKEPLLRVTQLWRAYDAGAVSGKFRIRPPPNIYFGQGPLQSPSVFNFFSPFYAPPGEIRDGGWVAPELEIATEYQNTLVTNFFAVQAFSLNSSSTQNISEDSVIIDIAEEEAAAADSQELADLVADKLLGGSISATLEQEVIDMVERIPAAEVTARAAEAIFLIAGSPEFAYQN